MSLRTVAIVLAAAAVAAGGATAPKPSIISDSWNLRIEQHRPEPIKVTLPGQVEAHIFWYMRYTLVNNTGEDRLIVPEFILYTDIGQILKAGRRIPNEVFTAIKQRHNEPLLRNMTDMTGIIRQGRDNAKMGVAIWHDFELASGGFDIFVGGLSGESVTVKLPKPVTVTVKTITGNRRRVTRNSVVLAKTLRLKYAIIGEPDARLSTHVTKVKEDWVMR